MRVQCRIVNDGNETMGALYSSWFCPVIPFLLLRSYKTIIKLRILSIVDRIFFPPPFCKSYFDLKTEFSYWYIDLRLKKKKEKKLFNLDFHRSKSFI